MQHTVRMTAFDSLGGAADGPTDTGRPLTIFLAEDDDDLRSMVAEILRKDGHRVIEARNGAELMADLCSGEINGPEPHEEPLIVTDLRLPIADGLSVIRGLRAQGRKPRFILMTAFGDEETHREAVRLGALAVLDKPFDLAQFRRSIASFARPDRST
jgi:CheY-like chemotaxis protein